MISIRVDVDADQVSVVGSNRREQEQRSTGSCTDLEDPPWLQLFDSLEQRADLASDLQRPDEGVAVAVAIGELNQRRNRRRTVTEPREVSAGGLHLHRG